MSHTSGGLFSIEFSPQEGWRRRLVGLQTQHKEETLQQQQEHLTQLHLLQEQLLQEIALNMSTTEAERQPVNEPASEPIGGASTGSSQTTPLKFVPNSLDRSNRSPHFVAFDKDVPKSSPILSRPNTGPEGSQNSPQNAALSTRIVKPKLLVSDQADVVRQTPSSYHPSGVSPLCPQAHSDSHTPSPTGPSQHHVHYGGSVNHTPSPAGAITSSQHQIHYGGSVSYTPSPVAVQSPSSHPQVCYGGSVSHTPSPLAGVSESPSSRPQVFYGVSHTPSPLAGVSESPASLQIHYGGHDSHTPSPFPATHCVLDGSHTYPDPLPTASTGLAPHSSPSVPNQNICWSSPTPPSEGTHPSTPLQVAFPPQSCVCPLTSYMSQSCPPGHTMDLSGSCDPQLSRTSLVEKHAKHILDLKVYYESELAVLSEKHAKLDSEGWRQTTPTRRSLNFDVMQRTPPVSGNPGLWGGGGAGDEAKLGNLMSENAMLRADCSRWNTMAQETKRLCDVLQEQKNNVEKQLLEWQEHCASSEKLITTLKDRLEATRNELQERDVLNQEMQFDLQRMAEDLRISRMERNRDLEKIDELINKYEELQLENIRLSQENSNSGVDLERNKTELMSLRNSIEEYKDLESKHTRTVQRLEEELRHLEHIKNRMHGMGTHYELGYDSPTEVQVRPMTSRSPSHPVKHSPSHRHTARQSPHRSPANPRPAPSTPSAQHHKEHPSIIMVSPVDKSLTRRKWLESSDPGLFGGSSPTPNSRDSGNLSKSKTPRTPSPSPVRKALFTPEKARTRHLSHYDMQPAYNMSREGVDHLTSTVLRAIREGKINTRDGGHAQKNMSVEEGVRRHAEVVAEAEHRLDMLLTEKEKLESSLQRTPRSGVKVNRQTKQIQLDKEQRLEQVMHEMGSVRMVLRKHHALGNKS